MERARLPGYASVARASEVLHLADRSVRDLIYRGRVPSLRVGRLHYIKTSDLEQERRRRLGLPARRKTERAPRTATPQQTERAPSAEHASPIPPHQTERAPSDEHASQIPPQQTERAPSDEQATRMPPHQQTQRAPRAPRQQSLDAELRRHRAAERAEQVSRWARRHGVVEPRVPARVLTITTPVTCDACGRTVRAGRVVELLTDTGVAGGQLCLSCGRRALLDWADRRRQEAAAARRLSQALGEPVADTSPTEASPDIRAA
ncbi:MAG: hypothetical protein JO057_17495 [Chloroflexi bacterium]|nr:hypothetical protein [Chloroflexota bacterium]